jgi:hypothetical protein
MSYLKTNEQIHIKNVEQLKAVYEVLKNEWYECYPLDREIYDFQRHGLKYVMWGNSFISLGNKNPIHKIITFNEFMSRVKPTTETTIIESVDGKKYKVIVVEEVVEPMGFWKWAQHHNKANASGKNIEDYVQYRKSLDL